MANTADIKTVLEKALLYKETKRLCGDFHRIAFNN